MFGISLKSNVCSAIGAWNLCFFTVIVPVPVQAPVGHGAEVSGKLKFETFGAGAVPDPQGRPPQFLALSPPDFFVLAGN